MAALTNDASALAYDRKMAATRILAIDYDRSPVADLGYSGWVAPKGQIRGCSLQPTEFVL